MKSRKRDWKIIANLGFVSAGRDGQIDRTCSGCLCRALEEGGESLLIRIQGHKDIMEAKSQFQTHYVSPNINVSKTWQVSSMCYLERVTVVRLDATEKKVEGSEDDLEGEGSSCQAL